jgi:hypothetical protein
VKSTSRAPLVSAHKSESHFRREQEKFPTVLSRSLPVMEQPTSDAVTASTHPATVTVETEALAAESAPPSVQQLGAPSANKRRAPTNRGDAIKKELTRLHDPSIKQAIEKAAGKSDSNDSKSGGIWEDLKRKTGIDKKLIQTLGLDDVEDVDDLKLVMYDWAKNSQVWGWVLTQLIAGADKRRMNRLIRTMPYQKLRSDAESVQPLLGQAIILGLLFLAFWMSFLVDRTLLSDEMQFVESKFVTVCGVVSAFLLLVFDLDRTNWYLRLIYHHSGLEALVERYIINGGEAEPEDEQEKKKAAGSIAASHPASPFLQPAPAWSSYLGKPIARHCGAFHLILTGKVWLQTLLLCSVLDFRYGHHAAEAVFIVLHVVWFVLQFSPSLRMVSWMQIAFHLGLTSIFFVFGLASTETQQLAIDACLFVTDEAPAWLALPVMGVLAHFLMHFWDGTAWAGATSKSQASLNLDADQAAEDASYHAEPKKAAPQEKQEIDITQGHDNALTSDSKYVAAKIIDFETKSGLTLAEIDALNRDMVKETNAKFDGMKKDVMDAMKIHPVAEVQAEEVEHHHQSTDGSERDHFGRTGLERYEYNTCFDHTRQTSVLWVVVIIILLLGLHFAYFRQASSDMLSPLVQIATLLLPLHVLLKACQHGLFYGTPADLAWIIGNVVAVQVALPDLLRVFPFWGTFQATIQYVLYSGAMLAALLTIVGMPLYLVLAITYYQFSKVSWFVQLSDGTFVEIITETVDEETNEIKHVLFKHTRDSPAGPEPRTFEIRRQQWERFEERTRLENEDAARVARESGGFSVIPPPPLPDLLTLKECGWMGIWSTDGEVVYFIGGFVMHAGCWWRLARDVENARRLPPSNPTQQCWERLYCLPPNVATSMDAALYEGRSVVRPGKTAWARIKYGIWWFQILLWWAVLRTYKYFQTSLPKVTFLHACVFGICLLLLFPLWNNIRARQNRARKAAKARKLRNQPQAVQCSMAEAVTSTAVPTTPMLVEAANTTIVPLKDKSV